MISDKVTLAVADAAKANGIEPAALLALVEIETGGKLFEQDGRTPQFLYERHVAWREATKLGCLPAFKSAGLAIPHWNKATQYKDQRTSAQRLDLIARARAIHAECADRSASWGLGQTMGNLAETLGFPNAVALVAHQTGSVDGQIDCMIREIKRSHLVEPMNSHDWTHVARIYNGPGYAANQYDVKLGNAHARWTRKLSTIAPAGTPREAPPEQALSPEEVRQVQVRLRDLGYHEVGAPDGKWGSRTTGALAAFQAHEGLPTTGHYDDATRDALNQALARPVDNERAAATAPDLKDAGSQTVAHADSVSLVGKAKLWLGIGGAGAAGAEKTGLIDTVKDGADQVSGLKETFDALSGVASFALAHWWVIAILAGLAAIYFAERIRKARLADHHTGIHAGPEA